jgi:folylpolyglutamate synthase
MIQNKTLIQVSFHLIFPCVSVDCDVAVVAVPEGASQEGFGDIWKKFHPSSHILYAANVQEALTTARGLGRGCGGMHTLITGSQHLVGAALFFMDSYHPDRHPA